MANIENKKGFHTSRWIGAGIGALIGAAGIAATAAVLLLKNPWMHKQKEHDQEDRKTNAFKQCQKHGRQKNGKQKNESGSSGKCKNKISKKQTLRKNLKSGNSCDQKIYNGAPSKYEFSHTPGFYEKYLKRPMDFCFALAAIIALSPIMAITAILVRFKLGTPVLFKQKRPGLHEHPFELYKFRSMTDEKDLDGNLLPDDVRLTAFGRKLRSTSLDELPELFNILKGDMSIVGPRPLLMEYLPYYTKKEHHRHDVRPGLTGLAQINGRNAIEWEDKFNYDLEYIQNCSFILDIKIILLTVKKVFTHSGIQVGSEIKAGRFDDHRKAQMTSAEAKN